MQLITSLLGTGLLFYLNFKGTKRDLESLNVKPHTEGELAPAEKLKQLADPDGKVDMTKSPRAEGHTEDGPHKTTVHVDHETQPPAIKARPRTAKKERPPISKQKTGDLDQLYRHAEEGLPDLLGPARAVAAKTEGRVALPPTPLKKRDRVTEKRAASADYSNVYDVARLSIVYPSLAKLRAAMPEIERRARWCE